MSSAYRTGRNRSTVGACERECRRRRSQATGEMTAFDHHRYDDGDRFGWIGLGMRRGCKQPDACERQGGAQSFL
jgi:hypothetical protein